MSLRATIRSVIDDATSAVLTDHIINEATEEILAVLATRLLAAEQAVEALSLIRGRDWRLDMSDAFDAEARLRAEGAIRAWQEANK